MPIAPKRAEIDHRTIKLIVGIIAISLAGLTSFFAHHVITSVSASYYEGDWSQSIFIGFLFAIAAFMMAYNGLSVSEMILSRVASFAALGVALYPCKCDDHVPPVPYVHSISAIVMFLILAFFCYKFYERAQAKGYPKAKVRAKIYVACGFSILSAIAVLGIDTFLNHAITGQVPRLVFYGETVGLVAFGISWLTASRTIPFLTNPNDRFSPLRSRNPN